VWNGMMIFGGGWFCLISSEVISVNNHTYACPHGPTSPPIPAQQIVRCSCDASDRDGRRSERAGSCDPLTCMGRSFAPATPHARCRAAWCWTCCAARQVASESRAARPATVPGSGAASIRLANHPLRSMSSPPTGTPSPSICTRDLVPGCTMLRLRSTRHRPWTRPACLFLSAWPLAPASLSCS